MQRSRTQFSTKDLYAAYLLQKAGEVAGFGRGAEKVTRRQTKYLFAFVAVSLLRNALQRADEVHDETAITEALVRVLSNSGAEEALIYATGEVVDGYIQEGAEDTVFTEEIFKERFGYDLNRFLKWEQLGRDLTKTPGFKTRLAFQYQFMGKAFGGLPSPRETLLNAINADA